MTILFADQNKDSSKWLEAFGEYKDLNLQVYPEIKNPADIEFVVAAKLPENLISKLPNLKCIACTGAGVNGLLNDKTISGSIMITRIVDNYLSNQLVHYCMLAVLTKLRNWDNYLNPEYSKNWIRMCPANTEHINIGIMGLGAIGTKIAQGFLDTGFKVKGLARTLHQQNFPCFTFDNIDEFLTELDFLICILPLTDETKGFCNLELFNKLTKPCYFINVGRGAQVVENDLVKALDSNKLSGACLDVFEKEPLPAEHLFWSHPKIIVTPHIAARSEPKYLVPQIVENYKRILKKEIPNNLVDRTKGY